MKIFLDDIRPCPEGHIVARNPQAFYFLVTNNFDSITEISMDHDLGHWDDSGKEVTGYDLLCWLEELITSINSTRTILGQPTPKIPFAIKVHSSNPVGKQRMEAVINKLYAKE